MNLISEITAGEYRIRRVKLKNREISEARNHRGGFRVMIVSQIWIKYISRIGSHGSNVIDAYDKYGLHAYGEGSRCAAWPRNAPAR